MTVDEVKALMRTRRLRYHFRVRWSHIDPHNDYAHTPMRLVQVPARSVGGLLVDLPGSAHVAADLNGKDLVIGL